MIELQLKKPVTAFKVQEVNDDTLKLLSDYINGYPNQSTFGIWDAEHFFINNGRGTELLGKGKWLFGNQDGIEVRDNAFVRENYVLYIKKQEPLILVTPPSTPVVIPQILGVPVPDLEEKVKELFPTTPAVIPAPETIIETPVKPTV